MRVCLFSLKFCFGLTLQLFFASASFPLSAQPLVRPVDITEIVQRSAAIVHGRVQEVVWEPHPNHPEISTLKITMEVVDGVCGVSGTHLTFRTFTFSRRNGGAGASQRGKGMPAAFGGHRFLAGQELVLFLYPESNLGLTSPVGGGQGTFRVSRDPSGRSFVLNIFGNQGLFEETPLSPKRLRERFGHELRQLRAEPGPLSLERFLELVRAMAAGEPR